MLSALHGKFDENLKQALSSSSVLLTGADIRARAVHDIAELLRSEQALTPTQQEITQVFDEIFADLIGSIYLAGLAMDKPARMLLRRALELGIAVPYLWDIPHIYWMWKEHDQDLSFKEMVEHLSDLKYKTFLLRENPHYAEEEVLNSGSANNIYRSLSNIVHGKISDFESTSPERFKFSEPDWREHLALTCTIERMLLNLWKCRFAVVSKSWGDRFVHLEEQC